MYFVLFQHFFPSRVFSLVLFSTFSPVSPFFFKQVTFDIHYRQIKYEGDNVLPPGGGDDDDDGINTTNAHTLHTPSRRQYTPPYTAHTCTHNTTQHMHAIVINKIIQQVIDGILLPKLYQLEVV